MIALLHRNGGDIMFVQNLSDMADQPYSGEIELLATGIMRIFEEECKKLANQGSRSICTFAKFPSEEYTFVNHEVEFGNYGRNWMLSNVPESMSEYFYVRTQELIRAKLRAAGFVGYAVEEVIEGPIYLNLWVCGHMTIFKDRSDPRYSKKIKITARW